MFSSTDMPTGKFVTAQQTSFQFLGAGLRASTLRGKVKTVKKFMAWLRLTHQLAFRRLPQASPSEGTSTSGVAADSVVSCAVSVPTTLRCRSSAVKRLLSGVQRSFPMTPNFRRISTHFLGKDGCATAGQRNRATLALLSQHSGRSSRKLSFDRDDDEASAPAAETLSYLASLRTEPEEEVSSSPDGGAAPKLSGWRGSGSPDTPREMCDGMSLASLDRWSPDHRKYPSRNVWIEVSKLITRVFT